jgi:hypothetical protein
MLQAEANTTKHTLYILPYPVFVPATTTVLNGHHRQHSQSCTHKGAKTSLQRQQPSRCAARLTG